ncbi:hypothetical protein OCGS_1347 [Oceaniovalibus guishaninsula JLT2003]|uniref:Uncharacterized protein n=1 Tax=Oceaniovalibus guishaninsula JLT2003 TaxID=1231392 RepID=K2HNS3_9RHOB|nr:hypothetical protein OCGS_1347 [Oceaniovalibus guishaninsula JLT2003]
MKDGLHSQYSLWRDAGKRCRTVAADRQRAIPRKAAVADRAALRRISDGPACISGKSTRFWAGTNRLRFRTAFLYRAGSV